MTIARKLQIGCILVVLAGVGAYLLMPSLTKDMVSERALVPLRVAVANAGGEFSSLVIVAHTQGYFVDEGLDLTLLKEESGVAALKSLRAGKVDIVTASDFAFVNNSFVDTSAKIIATIDTANGVEVVARRDAGISAPADMKGKKIGVVPQTAAEFVLVRFLIINNLSLDDLTVVHLTYANAQEAIMDGIVDAVIINNPFAYNISKALGSTGVSWQAQYGQPLLFNAISSDTFIDSRPREIESFLRALVRAEKFMQLNPSQAKQAVRESFAFTQDYIDQLWAHHVFAVRLDQTLLQIVEAQARWVLSNKESESANIPNYLTRVYVGGLRVVAPEAVTIIQ